jgi:hypothetical protein
MRPTSLVFALSALALTLGCSSSAKSGGRDLPLTFTATARTPSGDVSYEAEVNLDTVASCEYRRTAKTLKLVLTGGEENTATVSVNSFTGVGRYEAKGDSALFTSVVFQLLFTAKTAGNEPTSLTLGTWDAASSTSYPCNVEVTATDLPDTVMTAGEGTGAVSLTLTCLALGGSQDGQVSATMDPSSFELTIDDCKAQE